MGHLVELSIGGPGVGWSTGLVRALVCVGLPLAVWAGLLAAQDGWRGRCRPVPPALLVAQQVGAFGAVELVEGSLRGSSPLALMTRPGFWVGIGIHGLVGLATWMGLRVATRVGRALAGVGTGGQRWAVWPVAAWWRWHRSVRPTPVLALSSLSRRGPPPAVPAPLVA